MLFWLVVLALLLHCAGSGCNGSPSAVRVVDSHFVEVRHLGSGIRSLNWDDLHNHLDVGSISSWANGIERSDSVELASLFASVCFTETEPVEEGGMHVMSVIRPLTLLEINQLLDDSDDGKTVPSACLDGMKSVRAAALAAGASSRGKSARRGGHGLPYGANGGMTNLDDKALEVAQREYAYLLGGSKESVPLEQTIVIRRSPDSPKPSMLGEIVVTRKNADVYENFQLGYWNNRVESEAWSDKFKSAFHKVQEAFPASAEGDELIYMTDNYIFASLDSRIGAIESLKIDIHGNTYEWGPPKGGRYLDPKDSSDWEDGFSENLDPAVAQLFTIARWKSDETGKKLILDIEGACKSSKDDNSDLKAVALIINRLDKPNIDTSEAQNVYAIYDDLFFAVGDEVNPTVSRICKNRVIRQTAELHSRSIVFPFVIDPVQEIRRKSASLRRSRGSRDDRFKKLPDFALEAIKRVLIAMGRQRGSASRRLSRSASRGEIGTKGKKVDWPAVAGFLKSEGKSPGLRAKSGVVLIEFTDTLRVKGNLVDLWHLRNGFLDPRNEPTKELLKKAFSIKKHHFILQVGGSHEKEEMKSMVKKLSQSKEACNKKKSVEYVKRDTQFHLSSYLFEADTRACLNSMFEIGSSSDLSAERRSKEGDDDEDTMLFIRLRKGFEDKNLGTAPPTSFEFRRIFSQPVNSHKRKSESVRVSNSKRSRMNEVE